MNRLLNEINETGVEPGTFRCWWIGQEGFVFKTSRQIIYIDPDGIPLIAQASPGARFIVPECAIETLLGFGIPPERVHSLRGDDSIVVDGLMVHAVPGKHEEFNEDPEHGFPFLGYIFELEGHTVFHAGDTIPYPGQVDKVLPHDVDLAFLPINGRDEFRHALDFEGNFTCEEAVGFGLAIQAGLTIPMHYDMFTLNTADVRDFERIADHRGLRHYVMQHEEGIVFPG
jgi:L-ascorbate metabolism protein UlaG (beta-lactamase superfamily)